MDARKRDRARFIYRLRVRGVGPSADFMGHLIDVTSEGMMLAGNMPLKTDTRLSLVVELPRNAMGNGYMAFDASVRWCEPASPDGFYRLGVYLDHVPEASGELLEVLMDRFHEHPLASGDLDADDPYAQKAGSGLLG